MELRQIALEKADQVTIANLNRPDRLNVLSLDLMEELCAFAESLVSDCETRVVIFAGEGPHFSAGADLADPRRAALTEASMVERRRMAALGQRLTRSLLDIPQITIAAIHGAALGGAAVIASALDFRIGAEDAVVGYPEIDLGMNLSWYGLPLCVRLVGPARAKRFVILGQKETASTLLGWGFFDEVVPNDRLLQRAREMAEEYAAKPPVAAQMIKRSVNAIALAHDQAIMHMDADQLLLTMTTQDHREGIAAFKEKRPPNFKGR